MSTPEENTLFVGLAKFAASAELHVGKDGVNPHFNYNYMTEPALFNAARAALAEAGLSATISFANGKHETVDGFDRNGKPTVSIMATVEAILTIRDQHGQFAVSSAYGQGMDAADKSYAKAMTMAAKYVVQKSLMIPVDSDDTDSEGSSGVVVRNLGGGAASDKQLGFMKKLLTEKGLTSPNGHDVEAVGLRLARMQGGSYETFSRIDKAMASDLIERLMKVNDGSAVLAKLAQWEGEHGHAPAAAAPVAAPPAGAPAAGEVLPGETANEAMDRMVREEALSEFNPANEPPPPVVQPPPTVETTEQVDTISPAQIRLVQTLAGQAGFTDARRHEVLAEVAGTPHADRIPKRLMDAVVTRLRAEIEANTDD